ncbi:unnamed protein product, partial [Polarella glacialis]
SLVANPFEKDGVDVNRRAGAVSAAEHVIHNGRVEQELVQSCGKGLTKQGISLQQHRSAVRDFHDEAEVRAKYYPELLDLAGRLLGTDKVIVASHVLRRVDSP